MIRTAFALAAVPLLAVAISALAPPLHAQARPKYVATIPYDFTITDTRMPAGTYQIVPLSAHSLRFETPNGRPVANLMVYPSVDGRGDSMGRLRFIKSDAGYFLVEFSAPDQLPGPHAASRFMLTRQQRAARKEAPGSQHASPDAGREVAVNAIR